MALFNPAVTGHMGLSNIGMGTTPYPIDAFFRPRSVAVIGASDTLGTPGRSVLVNLMTSSFGGTVHPGNVDLAVIATPAQSVPDLITQCVEKNVRAAIVLSTGFRESGPDGAALEREVLLRARAGKLRVLGPNCLGVMSPVSGLNASFAAELARPGTVGFASQSGALCTSILDWSLTQQFGFSAFISMGSMIDVGWGDVIYYFGDDSRTKAILLYMETIGDARSFLSAAREVALTKPIILIKAGRTAAAASAAVSHTGALSGSDAVLDAVFERAGLLRVESIEELFSMADVLAKQPRPAGKRLAMITNAGGPTVLATDALVEGHGEPAHLSDATIEALDHVLPPQWSHGDPVDVLGDASAERYAEAVKLVGCDKGTDALLVTYAPQGAASPIEVAELLKTLKVPHKPILAAWMGGSEVAAGAEILERAGIPTFAYPDDAARIFNLMWRYDANLRALLETPTLPPDEGAPNRALARALFSKALAEGRTLLNEGESKQLLEAYDIATASTLVATTPEAAVAAAESLGYPVAVKIHSDKIAHKTDVGGVILRVADADGVKLAFEQIETAICAVLGRDGFEGVTVQPMIDAADGYELIFGCSQDDQFGPVLLFGYGGQLVEVFRDRALGLPPLTVTLARHMIERTLIYKALQGVRGRRPIDVDALAQCLVRFSDLIVDHPRIKEIEINPLLATPDRLIALDARVELHAAEIPDDVLPRTTIRPYPAQYEGTWTARDGTELIIRPIRPEDEPLMRAFHSQLSDESVYLRYAHAVRLSDRVQHDRLARLCFIDYAHEMALVVLRTDAAGGRELVAVGRLVMEHVRNEAEFALLISDSFQGRGLGTELLRRLIEIGRRERVGRIVGYILADNMSMLDVCRRLGFHHVHEIGDPMVQSIIDLN
jgi:acetyltransferase